MTDFNAAFAVWLRAEGTFAAGVEQVEYTEWRRRHGLPPQAVANITAQETQDLLRDFYWGPDSLGSLPQGWATFCFVEASNLPSGAGIKLMQAALAWDGYYQGAIDGEVGALTIKAANLAPATTVETAIVAALGHYATCSSADIQKGLMRRLKLIQQAIGMKQDTNDPT